MKPTRPRRSLSSPVRPLANARSSARSGRRPLLPEAAWSPLAELLLPRGAGAAEGRAARAAAEELLWSLRRSAGWETRTEAGAASAGTRHQWRRWLADGSWVRFWKGYVSRLDARSKRAWLRALERSGTRLSAADASGRDAGRRRVWWLVSLALLKRELHAAE